MATKGAAVRSTRKKVKSPASSAAPKKRAAPARGVAKAPARAPAKAAKKMPAAKKATKPAAKPTAKRSARVTVATKSPAKSAAKPVVKAAKAPKAPAKAPARRMAKPAAKAAPPVVAMVTAVEASVVVERFAPAALVEITPKRKIVRDTLVALHRETDSNGGDPAAADVLAFLADPAGADTELFSRVRALPIQRWYVDPSKPNEAERGALWTSVRKEMNKLPPGDNPGGWTNTARVLELAEIADET